VSASEIMTAFRDAFPIDDGEVTAVAEALSRTLAEATRVWPDTMIAPTTFAAHVAARLPDDRPAVAGLAGINAPDLYLACACRAGDPRALAACDEILRNEAVTVAGAARADTSTTDEAIQLVRTLLFLPRPERPPAIDDYAGRGPLRAWLRVILTRELIRLGKQAGRDLHADVDLFDAPDVYDDPAFATLKARYRDQLAAAFRAALDALPPRDRSLLRYQVLDGLSIDEIGTIYRVHRATAARWLARIRADLIDATLGRVSQELAIGEDSAASILRLVQSQLELSVIRHLR
jgi:RNA polymerase sigma-70 factor (ECF subfamily)